MAVVLLAPLFFASVLSRLMVLEGSKALPESACFKYLTPSRWRAHGLILVVNHGAMDVMLIVR